MIYFSFLLLLPRHSVSHISSTILNQSAIWRWAQNVDYSGGNAQYLDQDKGEGRSKKGDAVIDWLGRGRREIFVRFSMQTCNLMASL
jgi:hypothetical protein